MRPLFLAALAALGGAAVAQTPHHHHQEAGPAVAPDYTPATGTTPFDLGIRVTRSDGAVVDLASLKGRPTIMTMFFASCPDVCPLLTEHIQQAEEAIPPDERDSLQVVMVSFDERDTPAVLDGYRTAHAIASPHWTVGTATPEASQRLGEVLGVRFQKLPNGSFNHSAMVALIAADGTVLARVPGPSLTDPQFPLAIRAMLSMSKTQAP